jgi:hypothetical protein
MATPAPQSSPGTTAAAWWWGQRDSNPHGFRQRFLRPPCMPFHHAPSVRQPNRQETKESIEQRRFWLAPILCAMLLNSNESSDFAWDRLEATGGFEPPDRGFADPRLNLLATSPDENGAEDGIRTRDLLLGKETRYHCATSARSLVPRVRIELTTPQFSVACSTD